jgi:hypothetical protein
MYTGTWVQLEVETKKNVGEKARESERKGGRGVGRGVMARERCVF